MHSHPTLAYDKATKQLELDAWISTHPSFIAYQLPKGAPFPPDFPTFLAKGLEPEECRLRREIAADNNLKHITAPLPKNLFKSSLMLLKTAQRLRLITQAQYHACQTTINSVKESCAPLSLNNDIQCNVIKRDAQYLIELPIPWINEDLLDSNSSAYEDYMEIINSLEGQLPQKYFISGPDGKADYTTTFLQIALDRLDPIDPYLANVWDTFTRLHLSIESEMSLCALLIQFRQSVITNSYPALYAYYNCLPSISNTVPFTLLRGSAQNIISAPYRSKVKYEVPLLFPLENHGVPFIWNLQENTIILGQRTLLFAHTVAAKQQGVILFFVEDLTAHQKHFFGLAHSLAASGAVTVAHTMIAATAVAAASAVAMSTPPPVAHDYPTHSQRDAGLLLKIQAQKKTLNEELESPWGTGTFFHDATQKQIKLQIIDTLIRKFSAPTPDYYDIYTYIVQMQTSHTFLKRGLLTYTSNTVSLLEEIKKYCSQYPPTQTLTSAPLPP
jgi:hypothetical protein